MLRYLIAFWRNLFRRARFDRELDEEIGSYVELLAAEKMQSGMPREQALRKARLELGSLEGLKENVRDVKIGVFTSAVFQDIRYSVRTLFQRPRFALAAIVTLALGIGENTAVFSVMNATLLNSLPFKTMHEPERIVMLWERHPELSLLPEGRLPVRMKTYRAWEQSHSFESLALYDNANFNLTDKNDVARHKPERIEAGAVTPGFLPLLGIRPELGRNFNADETKPGKLKFAILTHALFLSRFSGNPKVLGTFLYADGRPYTIIGVLPAGFELPSTAEGFEQPKPAMLVPMNMNPGPEAEGQLEYLVYGRLKKGVSREQARAEVVSISNRLAKNNKEEYGGFSALIYSLTQEDVGPVLRRFLIVLQVAVGFVLLIACANVANLCLTRAIQREKEIAIRLALGASRWRVIRQLTIESLLLSILGGVGGLAVAFWTLQAIAHFAPDTTHGFHELRIDVRILLFTSAAALASGLLFGLAPARHALRQNMNEALASGARSILGTSNALRNVLVVGEIALTLILLVGTGLMIRSLNAVMTTDLGFQVDHLFTLQLELPRMKYKTSLQIAAFNSQFLDKVRQLPGVVAAALTNALPLRSVQVSSYTIEGRPVKTSPIPASSFARVSDGYFETMHSQFIHGRPFTRNEALLSRPVAIINETFARMNWLGKDPIGKILITGNEDGKEVQHAVVGIVGDERQMGPDASSQATFYLPGKQLDSPILIARTMGDPLAMAAMIKQQVWDLDPELSVTVVNSMEGVLHDWAAPRRFNLSVLGYFAGGALLLAFIGLYGVLTYSIRQRFREIGIRVALGAQPKDIAKLVLSQGFTLGILGIGLGIGGAWALTRFMQSLLFGVSQTDPYTFIAVVLTMMGVTLAASYFPARSATRIDPMDVLRLE